MHLADDHLLLALTKFGRFVAQEIAVFWPEGARFISMSSALALSRTVHLRLVKPYTPDHSRSTPLRMAVGRKPA